MNGWAKTLWVGLGGFLGANARYWLGAWVQGHRWAAGWPWGTFVINVTGSFILGLFLSLLLGRLSAWHAAEIRLLVPVGFVGAYTTFSTFEYETYALASAGSLARAAANVVGSVVVGFFAVWLGARLGRG